MTLRLKAVLEGIGKTQTELAHEVGISVPGINLLCNRNIWPRRTPAHELQARILKALRQWVSSDAVLTNIFDELPEERGNAPQAGGPGCTDNNEDDQMLLRNETLTHEAREHFGLARSPFIDDVNALADVFTSASTRRARAALLDCALNQGFVALVGESGSGKTTLREELEERIRIEQRPVTVIKPYVMEMETTTRKGKPMWAGQISEAIIHTLDPASSIRSSTQARNKQVHKLLAESERAGYCNLLIIEEAHRMPVTTLRALKGFMELKTGLRRLLGVVLVGQPELDYILNDKDPTVREIVQRCERREMLPLDDDLRPYLAHKLSRIGASLEEVLADDALDAIRARLVRRPRGGSPAEARSICYPLVVNNLVTRALNAAAAVAMPRVTSDVIAGC